MFLYDHCDQLTGGTGNSVKDVILCGNRAGCFFAINQLILSNLFSFEMLVAPELEASQPEKINCNNYSNCNKTIILLE